MFKPNLAGKVDLELLDFDKYEYYADWKFDGIRGCVVDGVLVSRSLKPIPNDYIREMLSKPWFNGLDGELLIGDPTAPDCFRQSSSGVRSKEGRPNFVFHVFDYFGGDWRADYFSRQEQRKDLMGEIEWPHIEYSQLVQVKSLEDIERVEEWAVSSGYEGLILRRVDRPYKHGRSTNKISDQGLMKLTRRKTAEATILSVECGYYNANSATTNELGYTERSTHKENLIPKDTLGSIYVRDRDTKVEFSIGIFRGFTAFDLQQLWLKREELPGKVVSYDYFPVGRYERPRQPVMKGFRDLWDM